MDKYAEQQSAFYKYVCKNIIRRRPTASADESQSPVARGFDEDEVFNYIMKYKNDLSKITHKSFLRELPSVAQKLKDGSINPKVFDLWVRGTMTLVAGLEMSESLGVDVQQNEQAMEALLPPSQDKLRFLGNVCGSLHPCYMYHYDTTTRFEFEQPFTSERDHAEFCRCMNDYQRHLMKRARTRKTCTLYLDQRVLNLALEEWEMKHHPWYRVKHYDVLLSHLLLFAGGKSDCATIDLLESKLLNFALPITNRVQAVAQVFHWGADDYKYICWHCKDISKDIQRCSRCSVARYCTEACQRAHWSDCHKPKCKIVKRLKTIFDEELKTVDEAIEAETIEVTAGTREATEYMKPGAFLQYQLVQFVVECRSKGRNLLPGIEGPSLRIFYENMVKVFNDGEKLWFFDPMIPRDSTDTPGNERALSQIHKLMCFDVSNVDANSDSELARMCKESFAGNGLEIDVVLERTALQRWFRRQNVEEADTLSDYPDLSPRRKVLLKFNEFAQSLHSDDRTDHE